MFKIRNSLLPALGHHQFVVNSATHEYGTRKKDDLKLPYCRTNLRQNTICFQGPKLWNNIPADIKQTKSLNIFKRSVQLIMNLTSWISIYYNCVKVDWFLTSNIFSSSTLLLHAILN